MIADPNIPCRRIAIVGAGPAGLMAADAIVSQADGTGAEAIEVDIYDAMPSVGRKLLLAGRGGLNLTHGEPFDRFVERFGVARGWLEPLLRRFGPAEVRAFAAGLGIDTFVGSSNRVFPTDMKAAPLLRAWLHRLRQRGVRLHMRHRWMGGNGGGDADVVGAFGGRGAGEGLGEDEGGGTGAGGASADALRLRFATPTGAVQVAADAVVLALGGASWARLGSDGAWLPWLAARGVAVAPLQPSNCGFDRAGGWSDHLRSRHAGAPLKTVALRCEAPDGRRFEQRGECVITESGIEGSLVYAASALLRDTIAARGSAVAELDLLPDRSADAVFAEVARPRGPRSLATHLKSRLGLHGAKLALLHELLPRDALADPARLAAGLKALPLELAWPRPIDEAISSAGGVRLDAVDERLMLRAWPGVHVAGEMLDWEAPTGGYLLTACFATGMAAGLGALAHLRAAGGAAGGTGVAGRDGPAAPGRQEPA